MARDQVIIFVTAAMRSIAISFSSVIFPLHLATLHFNASMIALAVSLGLAGCAVATFVAAFLADRFGRRRTLVLSSLFMALGGVLLTFSSRVPVLFLSVFVGMVNGMGRDRGLGLTIEQVMIPQISTQFQRTRTFAWYNAIMDAGNALGALLAFIPVLLRTHFDISVLASYHWSWLFYSVACLVCALLTLRLTSKVEIKHAGPLRAFSNTSRPRVTKFAVLSGMDSFGGGFLSTAFLSYWFFKQFGVNEAFLGPLFFWVRVANGVSHFGAAWIAKKIGLVNTMVFTHLVSNILMIVIPFVLRLDVATLLFLLRELLVEMDVPTRQSYIVAIVDEHERTAAAGITNLVRGTAWALGPLATSGFIGLASLSAPLFVGSGIKILYDVLLYQSFRHIKPPEEQGLGTYGSP